MVAAFLLVFKKDISEQVPLSTASVSMEKKKVAKSVRGVQNLSVSYLFKESFSASDLCQYIFIDPIYNWNPLSYHSVYELGGLCYHTSWVPSRERVDVDNCYLPAASSLLCCLGTGTRLASLPPSSLLNHLLDMVPSWNTPPTGTNHLQEFEICTLLMERYEALSIDHGKLTLEAFHNNHLQWFLHGVGAFQWWGEHYQDLVSEVSC